MKQSVGWPGRLASAHSVATPFRRKLSGIAEKIVVSISFGGVSRYIIVVGSPVPARTIMERSARVDWALVKPPSPRSDYLSSARSQYSPGCAGAGRRDQQEDAWRPAGGISPPFQRRSWDS